MRSVAALALAGICWATSARAAGPVDWMVRLTLEGRQVEGMPLAWDDQLVHLLGRDGRLWEFEPERATDFAKTADRFRSYSISELRAELLRDLGEGFEVTSTTHYLVAHARGQQDKWAQRFEDLHRSFVHYFQVRGLRLSKPGFPLMGIVCRDQADFQRYTARQGAMAPSGLLGFYSLETNRILLYDMGGSTDSATWKENASVVIHEATHQTAFNTGVHSRYTPPPLWVVEGLATMFEAPGAYDSRNHPGQSDRVNRGRLSDFRQILEPKHRPELLASLVASESLFRKSIRAAYAEAWALTFYLVETQPRKYEAYLRRTAARPAFAEYTAAQRAADFTAVFGKDWRMLEAQFLRFMAGVK